LSRVAVYNDDQQADHVADRVFEHRGGDIGEVYRTSGRNAVVLSCQEVSKPWEEGHNWASHAPAEGFGEWMPVGARMVAERCRSRIAAEWIGKELRIINDVRTRVGDEGDMVVGGLDPSADKRVGTMRSTGIGGIEMVVGRREEQRDTDNQSHVNSHCPLIKAPITSLLTLLLTSTFIDAAHCSTLPQFPPVAEDCLPKADSDFASAQVYSWDLAFAFHNSVAHLFARLYPACTRVHFYLQFSMHLTRTCVHFHYPHEFADITEDLQLISEDEELELCRNLSPKNVELEFGGNSSLYN
ncbi:hypothetical protein B0H13DRAFT_1932716, partial [Mycena leptocephala]